MKNSRLLPMALFISIFWGCGSEDSSLDSGDINVSLNTIGSANLIITENGLPVTGVKVKVTEHSHYYPHEQYYNGQIYLDFLQNTLSEGTTNESGEYLIQDLPGASYKARIETLSGGRSQVYLIDFEIFSGITFQKNIDLKNYSGSIKVANRSVSTNTSYVRIEEFLSQFEENNDSVRILKLYFIEDYIFDHFDLVKYVESNYDSTNQNAVDSIISLYAVDSFNILSNSKVPQSISFPAGMYDIITKDKGFSRNSFVYVQPVKESTFNVVSYDQYIGNSQYVSRVKDVLINSSWEHVSTSRSYAFDTATSNILGEEFSTLTFSLPYHFSQRNSYISVAMTTKNSLSIEDLQAYMSFSSKYDSDLDSHIQELRIQNLDALNFYVNGITHRVERIYNDKTNLMVQYTVGESWWNTETYYAKFKLIE